jgi:YD repeat-containing protein
MSGGVAQAAAVQYVYDELGRLVAAIDPAGDTVIYAYDPAGNLVSVSRNSSSQLSIIAFQPVRGKVGDSVVIAGSAFIADVTQNVVSFSGTNAVIQSATATALTAAVPPGAVTGPITVSNANGIVTSSQSFVVVPPPIVTATTPSAVRRGEATLVEISGSNLLDVTAVEFDQAGISAVIQPGTTQTLLTVRLSVAADVPFGAYEFRLRNNVGDVALSGAVTLSVTAAPLGETLSVSRPVSVHLRAATAGAPAGNAMSVAQPVSVHLPATTPGAPSGNAMSVALPVSVYLPAQSPGAPGGNAMSVSGAVSVHLPAATPGAPAGNAMSVTPPVSVSMP